MQTHEWHAKPCMLREGQHPRGLLEQPSDELTLGSASAQPQADRWDHWGDGGQVVIDAQPPNPGNPVPGQ